MTFFFLRIQTSSKNLDIFSQSRVFCFSGFLFLFCLFFWILTFLKCSFIYQKSFFCSFLTHLFWLFSSSYGFFLLFRHFFRIQTFLLKNSLNLSKKFNLKKDFFSEFRLLTNLAFFLWILMFVSEYRFFSTFWHVSPNLKNGRTNPSLRWLTSLPLQPAGGLFCPYKC